jgi:pre-rRNA-processing protein TSR1
MRNKSHKSRHASKHEVARRAAAGGRAVKLPKFATSPTDGGGKGGNEAHHKVRQQQAAAAQRKAKADVTLAEKAIGSRSRGGPPRIVSFIALNESGNPHAALGSLAAECGSADDTDLSRPCTIATARHRFTTLLIPDLDEQRIIDAVKIADVVVFTLDCSAAVQETIKDINAEPVFDNMSAYSGSTWFADIGLCITGTTRELLHAINSHGSPTPVVVLQGLGSYASDKQRRHTLRIHERYFESTLAKEVRVLSDDSPNFGELILRTIANIKLRQLKWRDQHPYLLADTVTHDAESNTTELRGYLRGANASASMLFHVTNFGTYAGVEISAPGDPTGSNGEQVVGLLDNADADVQEGLEGFQKNETAFDEDAEFPTEADVAMAERTKTVWVPEGVSEYQAAWYQQEDDITAVEPMQRHEVIDTRSQRSAQSDAALLNAADVLRHEQLTDEERIAERKQLFEDCEDEERHADEVDCPYDIPARKRFAKYRAMKSFDTSAWDPKENLPLEYASIFELAAYSSIRKDSIAEAEQSPVPVGTYVSIRLAGAPASIVDSPFVICSGQLRHEQKWSVVHCHVQRSSEYTEPIKSKTPLFVHVGFRKFYAEPIFSDAVVGNRSKFARYFLPGEKFRIATFYAPITYHPSPVMMFEAPSLAGQRERAPLRLALFGSVMPPNPNFLILKRAVLTGRIATIYKKVLVVKHMFYNEDDVKWFQPVDLFTRLGRQGRIIKAVGTHGMFKASFNDTVFQHDMICMALWKRVFPKWRTVLYNESEHGVEEFGDSDDDADAC